MTHLPCPDTASSRSHTRAHTHTRITHRRRSVSVESGDRLDARRAFETALTRALASAHGAVGGAVDAEVLEGSVAVVSGGDGEGGVGGSSSGAPPVSAGSPSTDTVRLAGVVKAPASAEVKITSALAACHPDGARVVARAADLVALGIDARAATRRAVVGA